MRCFILFAVATLFASVVAAPAPAPAPAAEEPAAAAACSCAADKNGAEGELMNFGGKWYQCIYPSGTCIWDDNGRLLTVSQSHCTAEAQACAPRS